MPVQGELLVKDLAVFNRRIEDMVIVDNMATSFVNNVRSYLIRLIMEYQYLTFMMIN